MVFNGDTLDFTLTSGEARRTIAPANYVTANPAFIPDLSRKQVRIDVRTTPEQSPYSYGVILMAAAFLGVIGLALYRVTNGRIPALESKTRESQSRNADCHLRRRRRRR